MRQIIYIIGILLLSSCVKNDIDNNSQTQSNEPFSITFTTEDAFSSSTRAELDDVIENEILNIWVLMFDSKGDIIKQSDFNYTDDEGVYHDFSDNTGNTYENRIYGSVYIEDYVSPQVIYMDQEAAADLAYIRVVANTFDIFDEDDINTNFSPEHCETIGDYNNKYFALTNNADRENDMWQEINDKKYLRMAGNWGYVAGTEIDTATGELVNIGESLPAEGLDFCLGVLAKPLAAKISLNYTCNNYYVDEDNGEGVRITSVQVKRVPNRCYYKDVDDYTTSHDYTDDDYTTYQPRYANIDDGLYDYTGTSEFYVPQNMRGYATGYYLDDGVTLNDDFVSLSASDKSNPAYYPSHATCIVITGMYKAPFDSDSWASQEEQPIYIELYPGDDNNNYDIKLRRHYIINCTITPNVDGVDWDTDCRVSTEGDLPGAPIVHYEFNPDDYQYNSAYEPVTDEEGNVTYELMNMNYPGDGTNYVTNNYYINNSTANPTATTPSGTYTDSYLAGFAQYYTPHYIMGSIEIGSTAASFGTMTPENTLNVIANDGKRFMRNLAVRREKGEGEDKGKYDGYNGRVDSKGNDILHPEIFDCTFLKDHYKRYVGTTMNSHTFNSEYVGSSGVLNYYAGNNFIGASLLQLSTGWAKDLQTRKEPFTIVFIGSVGSNPYGFNNQDRGVYYGNTIHNAGRWYFYKYNLTTSQNIGVVTTVDGEMTTTYSSTPAYDYVSFGLGNKQTSPIEELEASSYQNVQAYDVCTGYSRKVYFNNVDVKDVPFDQDPDNNDGYYAEDITFSAPISIFGHDTPTNKDDAIDGRLRLFLVYDYALSLDEIDQIRKYAVLKGLLKYGEDDIDKFDVSVDAFGTTESSWDDGGGYDTNL